MPDIDVTCPHCYGSGCVPMCEQRDQQSRRQAGATRGRKGVTSA